MNIEEEKAYMKEYREKNKDRIKIQNNAYMKLYNQKNRERIKISNKRYYEKNKDRINQRNREYWNKNKDRFHIKSKEYRERNKHILSLKSKRNREKLMQDFLSYKKDKCCTFCGYKEYPEILQFHHKNTKDKSFDISTFRKKKLALLKTEMDKCILLCSNCHSWLHFNEKTNL